MADNKYLVSQSYLDREKRQRQNLARGIASAGGGAYTDRVSTFNRFIVKITGKYSGSNWTVPDSGGYAGTQQISDSAGVFQDGDFIWGDDADSASLSPIIDLRSLETVNGNSTDTTLQRLQPDSYVEVFQRGGEDGDTLWYTNGLEPHFDMSFGLDYVTVGSTEYLRVHSGYVYGESTSTLISGANYLLSGTTWIYVQYVVTLATGAIAVTAGLQTAGSRPTEVTVTSTTRTVNTVIASISGGHVDEYWDGDIYAPNFGEGLQGPQGNQGFQGFQGFQGPSGVSGAQGFQGFQGPAGVSGAQGFQGFQGLKAAIVKTSEGHNALSCIESPEVLFFDVVTIKHDNLTSKTAIDPMFIEVCEDDIRVVSTNCDKPVLIGAKVVNGEILISTNQYGIDSVDIVCMIAGTRKGFSGTRFPKCTEEQYTTNMRFWNNIGGR